MNFKNYLSALGIVMLLIVACDNESLEGNFLSEGHDNPITSFEADVDDVRFVADTARAATVEGVTEVLGIKSNGDNIVLSFRGTSTGTFDLVTEGEGTFGIEIEPIAFSSNTTGGTGSVTVTDYNIEEELISGTFSFIARRAILNSDGNPVLDGNGNPTYNSVTITNGEFNNVNLISDGSAPAEEPQSPKLLMRTTETGGLNTITEYTYTEDFEIQKISYQNNEGLVEQYFIFENSLLSKIEYHYDGIYDGHYEEYESEGGRIISKSIYHEFSTLQERVEYLYAGNRVGQIRVYLPEEEEYYLRYHLSYDGQGNTSTYKVDYRLGNDNDVIFEYTYDDQVHYLRNFVPAIVLISDHHATRNNVLSKTEKKFPFSKIENVWEYTFEYDEDSFPVTGVKTRNGSNPVSLTFEYY